jgi:hypothetical protein
MKLCVATVEALRKKKKQGELSLSQKQFVVF